MQQCYILIIVQLVALKLVKFRALRAIQIFYNQLHLLQH